MDLKQIEKLMAAMEHSRIKRIVIKRQDFEIEMEKESCLPLPSTHAMPLPSHPSPIFHEHKSKVVSDSNVSIEKKTDSEESLFVTSPMVGTYYSPEDPPFLKMGDVVSENTVVCIIEAMKVMNEVKAGVKGTVTEILLKNGEPVEFGTHILRVNPS